MLLKLYFIDEKTKLIKAPEITDKDFRPVELNPIPLFLPVKIESTTYVHSTVECAGILIFLPDLCGMIINAGKTAIHCPLCHNKVGTIIDVDIEKAEIENQKIRQALNEKEDAGDLN